MSTLQLLLSFSSLSIFLVGFIFILPYFTSSLRNIPGPFLAKFTNLWRLFNTYDGRAELRHRQLHEQYGPVVRLGPNVVSLSDPKLIKTIYSFRGEFLKSGFYSVNDVKVGKSRVATIFGTRSNAVQTSLHRLLHKYYTIQALKEFEPQVNTTLETLHMRLTQKFIDGTDSNVCKMEEWFSFFSFDLIGQITFSKPFGLLEKGDDVNDMIRIAQKAMDYFSIVGQMPWLDELLDKNPIKRIGPPSYNVAAGFCANQVMNRLSGADKHDPEKQKDFLDYFMTIKAENPGVIDFNEIVGFLLLNVLAGADTTTAIMCAILYYVLKNPNVYQKLRSELDSSKLSSPIAYDDAIALPYLTAVVRESMRMCPSIGLPLERIVPETGSGLTTPNGVFLPPGTIVGMNAWVVHMDKTAFGQDAAVFKPERWLRSDGESEEDFKSRIAVMNSTDLTFGAGKRVCLGKNVALLQIYKTIPMLFHKYDLRLADPTKEWNIQNSWMVRQTGVDVKIQLR